MQACRSTFVLCTPLLGLRKLQTHVTLNMEKSGEKLQEAVCSHLVSKLWPRVRLSGVRDFPWPRDLEHGVLFREVVEQHLAWQ